MSTSIYSTTKFVFPAKWFTYDEDGYSVNYVVAIKDSKQASPDEVFAERNAKSELSHPNVLELIGFAQLSEYRLDGIC